MPFQAACPACNAKINVPDNMAGKKAKCPKCQNVFVLPGDADTVTAAPTSAPARSRADDDMDLENDRPVRGRRSRDDDFDAPRSTGGTNGLAIAGMVLGIVAIVFAIIPCLWLVWYIGLTIALVGVVLSGIGLATANKTGSGKGMAISGLALSIVSIVIYPLIFFVLQAWFFGLANQAKNQIDLRPNIQINDKKVNFNDAKINFNDADKN
ncbi:MAG: hypothetical protein K2X38_14160 [Gemmataceae bacterium]|nr:hypothetical protein [Gemmataceae bacterium]